MVAGPCARDQNLLIPWSAVSMKCGVRALSPVSVTCRAGPETQAAEAGRRAQAPHEEHEDGRQGGGQQ
ncbi:hypothetical protein ACH4UM_23485 [Streptomyces sp. NPDC020801]|uniref:hypothetical protein n=1 Tax=unclassified Streptomyces TaxID=2593676 RepID=UPI003796B39A